jgi:hypothetical protein
MFRFRPSLFNLETREVLSSAAVIAPPSAPALVSGPHAPVGQIVPMSITNVVNAGGNLVAQGLLGSTPFTAPLTLSTRPNTAAAPDAATAPCPILDLTLGPIDLNLLGLEVKTSQICLNLTALPGEGNLLGNLLCDVGHLLDSGTPLGTLLDNLTSTDLGNLTSGITGLLNGALGQATTLSTGPNSPSLAADPSTNILHLSLGPVDLNLLGLDVHLDDCNNGPVTVDIIAHSGPGNLLGNLIGGVAHILDSNGSTGGLSPLLNRIVGIIDGLL